MQSNDEAFKVEQTFNALTVKTATGDHKAFLQSGFYLTSYATSYIHEHNYAEIHLIVGGSATFTIENKRVCAESGTMLVIPKRTFHSCDQKDDDTLHCAFQIDCEPKRYKKYPQSESIILEFFKLIERTSPVDDHSAVAAYVALFCSAFEQTDKLLPTPQTDYGFLIFEFFSKKYAEDVRLSDLAEFLHVSERQAERLVLEHTSHSFRDELAATRVRIARKLQESSELSLAQIAEYTDYRSYAGLWKAKKKFEQ